MSFKVTSDGLKRNKYIIRLDTGTNGGIYPDRGKISCIFSSQKVGNYKKIRDYKRLIAGRISTLKYFYQASSTAKQSGDTMTPKHHPNAGSRATKRA